MKIFLKKVEQEKKTTKGLYILTKDICGYKSITTPQQYVSEGKIIRKTFTKWLICKWTIMSKKVNNLLRGHPFV